MLDRVEFKNFKALADVTVTLAPLTVIVGANGAGKTSVLEGIDMLGLALHIQTTQGEDTRANRLGEFDLKHLPTLDANDTTSVAADNEADTRLKLEISDERWELQIGSGAPKAMETVKSVAEVFGDYGRPWPEGVLTSTLRTCLRLQLDRRALAAASLTSESEDEGPPTLAEDGAGLASIIAYLLEIRSEAIGRIESELRGIVPQIGRLRIQRTRIRRREQEILTVNGEHLTRWVKRNLAGYALEAEIAGRGYVPAHMLSDGTLITLGILTALHGPNPPSLLLLDDIDRGLHPLAQRKLIECLRRLRAQHPQLQIVCTSHSPYFLDALAPEEVRVMKLDADGHAHCKALTEHPEWEQWKDSMTPGEFWSSVGEDWVYGEEPAAESEP